MLKALPLSGEKSCPAALMLGSFPGAESLRLRQYYAHPRNLFWPLLSAAFGENTPKTYPARLRFLKKHRLALCDTLQACTREGSLDSDIKQAIPNREVAAFLRGFPRLPVIFTSRTAQALFARHFKSVRQGRQEFCLPSPSPANAAMPPGEKQRLWKEIMSRVSGAYGTGL